MKIVGIPTWIFILDWPYALGFFSVVEEDLILSFSRIIDDEWFHWGSVDKSFWPFAFVTFIADIIVVAFVASIVLAFVGDVVTDERVLFVWGLALVFSIRVFLIDLDLDLIFAL